MSIGIGQLSIHKHGILAVHATAVIAYSYCPFRASVCLIPFSNRKIFHTNNANTNGDSKPCTHRDIAQLNHYCRFYCFNGFHSTYFRSPHRHFFVLNSWHFIGVHCLSYYTKILFFVNVFANRKCTFQLLQNSVEICTDDFSPIFKNFFQRESSKSFHHIFFAKIEMASCQGQSTESKKNTYIALYYGH